MMLLATIVIVSGSLARMPYLLPLAILPPLYVYTLSLLFGALLFLLHWGMTRAVNRPYLIGYLAIMIASFVFAGLGSTGVWTRLVDTLVL
jgi:nitrate/nitrite transporter NarK